jgi:hypothetical protein
MHRLRQRVGERLLALETWYPGLARWVNLPSIATQRRLPTGAGHVAQALLPEVYR